MKHKLPCELIRDLFPSYIDGLTSDVTNGAVEEHVAECENCKTILEAMREPSAEPMDSCDKKEIDFLKKTRSKMQKAIFGTVLISLLVIVSVLLARMYFVGSYVYGDSVSCQLSVDGNHLAISGMTVDTKFGVSSIEYKEADGEITISFKAVRKSPFHKREFQSEYTASEEISQVYLGERIIWSQGENISPVTSAVYNSRHPYVGDMPANGRTVTAMNLVNYLGNFKNQLQTSEEPYGWTMILEKWILSSQEDEMVQKMKSYSYVLLAVIDNLGSVTFEYTVDGQVKTVTVDIEEASEAAGQNIKICGQDVLLLQELMEKYGL